MVLACGRLKYLRDVIDLDHGGRCLPSRRSFYLKIRSRSHYVHSLFFRIKAAKAGNQSPASNSEPGPACRLVEPRPFGSTLMRHRTARGLADQSRVFGQRACPVPRERWLPSLAPSCNFAFIHQKIHSTRTSVNPDAVTVAH